jgi:phosphoglycerate dehydrogenase-like enzyme
MKILFFEREHPADLDIYRAAIAETFPNVTVATAASEDEALAQTEGATALFAKAHEIGATLVAAMPRLEWIQALTTGTDHLRTLNLPPSVVTTSARGVHGPQMSELAFLYMLALERDIRTLLADQERARWERRPQRLLLHKTVVIVGVGMISEALALRCKAFGMTTIGVSATPRSLAGFDEIVAREDLPKAAANADFLIVLAPYTPETHHLIDAKIFSVMRPQSVFINIARGKVCDEAALIGALYNGSIAGAGLDVFEEEPLPPDSPLWAMRNVIITPRIGGMSDSYASQLLPIILENLALYLKGAPEQFRNIVR